MPPRKKLLHDLMEKKLLYYAYIIISWKELKNTHFLFSLYFDKIRNIFEGRLHVRRSS